MAVGRQKSPAPGTCGATFNGKNRQLLPKRGIFCHLTTAHLLPYFVPSNFDWMMGSSQA